MIRNVMCLGRLIMGMVIIPLGRTQHKLQNAIFFIVIVKLLNEKPFLLLTNLLILQKNYVVYMYMQIFFIFASNQFTLRLSS